jgi:hypothetical protein
MALGFLALLALNVFSSLAIAGLSAVARRGRKGDATTIKPPRVEPGAPLPIVFGTVRVAPNVVWYTVDSFRYRSNGKPEVKFGLAGAICHGVIDELVSVTLDDGTVQPVVSDADIPKTRGISTHTRFPIGFSARVPGSWLTVSTALTGYVDFFWGLDAQPVSTYLQGKVGSTRCPTYKGTSYVVFEGMTYTAAPQIPPLWVTVRRSPGTLPGMDVEHDNIDGDANPAAVIWDILTDTRWGLAVPESAIDDASLAAASAVLFEEGLGVSGLIEHHEEAESVIEDICRHVGGVVQTDPATGLIRFDLIRDDDAADAHELTVNNATFVECTRPSQAELRNVVKITHRAEDAASNTSAERVMDITGVQRMGGQRVEPLDLMLFRSVASVQWAGHRALRALALPLARLRVRVDRRAAGWRIGTKFLATWDDAGLAVTAFRVVAIDWGTLEEGTIEVEAVEEAAGGVGTGDVPSPPEEDCPVVVAEAGAFEWETEEWETEYIQQYPPSGPGVGMNFGISTIGGEGVQLGGFHFFVTDDPTPYSMPTTIARAKRRLVGFTPNTGYWLRIGQTPWHALGSFIEAGMLVITGPEDGPPLRRNQQTIPSPGGIIGSPTYAWEQWAYADDEGGITITVQTFMQGNNTNGTVTFSVEAVLDYSSGCDPTKLIPEYGAPSLDVTDEQTDSDEATITATLTDPDGAWAGGWAELRFSTFEGGAWVEQAVANAADGITGADASAITETDDDPRTHSWVLALPSTGLAVRWRVELWGYLSIDDTELTLLDSAEGQAQAAAGGVEDVASKIVLVRDTNHPGEALLVNTQDGELVTVR